MGAALKARQPASVVGVEPDETYAAEARTRLDHVACATAEEFLGGPAPLQAPFDCVIAADALEHMVDPWSVMRDVATLLAPGGCVVISVPNVLYWPALKRVVVGGSWPRDDQGIFDATHLRWFTEADARALVDSAGLTIETVQHSYWTSSRRRLAVIRALSRTPASRFLAAQIFIRARKPAVSG
ncbi:hypothetical protein GCM10023147_28360 [Tsukamurella soli]|uniref:Methyltransferase domain-containing protein n=1 Tax=Tsukamurella soli TaxID=644556 RepID=A0ABP8JS86_9ACTN